MQPRFIESLEDRRLLSVTTGLLDCKEHSSPQTHSVAAHDGLALAAAATGKPNLKGTWHGSRTIPSLNDTLLLTLKITRHKKGSFTARVTSSADPSLRLTAVVNFTTTRKLRVSISGSDADGPITGGGTGKLSGTSTLSGKITFRASGQKFAGSFTFSK